MSNSFTRRGFMGSSSLAAAGVGLPSLAAAAQDRAAGANRRLSVGIVGPGGRGSSLLRNFFAVAKEQQAELSAVCDLWSRNRERSAALVQKLGGRQPRVFNRLEDMLGMEGLDAVIIGTPDHSHAQQIVQCLRGNKHVYCEKPFANRLDEANAAIDACRRSDKVVTLGTQRRSHPQYLSAQEVMRTGVIGDIVQVDIIQNAYSPYRWRRDADVKALREKDVDWRAFLMGRPNQPFDARKYLEFRLFRDFSTGIIDQWMTHMIDTVHMLTGATYPRSAVAQGGTYAWRDHRENGDTVNASLEYVLPAAEGRSPERRFLVNYMSTLANGFGSGCRILGRQGTLEYEDRWRVSGEGVRGSKVQARDIAPRAGLQGTMDTIHMANWLDCIRGGRRQTHCTAEHGYQHAIACIMTDRALHSGRRVLFDERARTIREG
ncbi:MAG: Gfo/Idh/MocA family oxidoreductase [Planctomycetes bacterium]|nr:Gfo/Idh/MocA family oxidoreductase [Planctomycetota bacterium]